MHSSYPWAAFIKSAAAYFETQLLSLCCLQMKSENQPGKNQKYRIVSQIHEKLGWSVWQTALSAPTNKGDSCK